MQNKKNSISSGLSQSLAGLAFKGGFALTLERRRARIEHMRAECLKEIESLPGPNESIFLIMNRTWTMADLVPVAFKLGGQIARMTIFTLGWSRQTITAIIEAKAAGEVLDVRIITSMFFRRASKGGLAESLPLLAEAKIPCVTVDTHMKVILFEWADGRRLSFHGSGNLRACHSIENLMGTGAPAVHKMMDTFADEIFAAPENFTN